MNHYFIIRVESNTMHKDFVITNTNSPEIAEEDALRRARAEGWVKPRVGQVTEAILTHLAPINS